jgi:hypothetical protein
MIIRITGVICTGITITETVVMTGKPSREIIKMIAEMAVAKAKTDNFNKFYRNWQKIPQLQISGFILSVLWFYISAKLNYNS